MSYSNSIKSSPLGMYHQASLSISNTLDNLKEKCLPMTVLADEVFGLNNEAVGDSDSSYYVQSQNYCNEYEQLELRLEDPRDILRHYKRMINHYERGFEKMCLYALKWYELEQDAADDNVIGKLLRDIQILRKLSGSRVL